MIHQAIHKTGSEQRIGQSKTSASLARPSFPLMQRRFDGTPQSGHNFADVAVHRPDNQPAAHVQAQAPPNQTGLPGALKVGVEQLAGISLDDVRVHYNSAKPAQLDALAFAQGRDIHVAPGQEQHLPHEAWHVVQQRQGRVKPTAQAKGMSINDDTILEREATVMGEKAPQMTRGGQVETRSMAQDSAPSQHVPAWQTISGTQVIQMVKYIRKTNGKIVEVADDYKKKPKEKEASEDQFLNARGGGEQADARRAQIREERAAQAAADRKRERAARRERVTPEHLPKDHIGKQVHFPDVVRREDNAAADLVYRGMSVNNIRNMQKGKKAIFTAQNPTGKASPVAHIVDDSEDSPYLSFEAGGLGVSAGKYAAKPVDPENKPFGVAKRPKGFLKQTKSYTKESRMNNPMAKRIGYVGGISSDAGAGRLDVSDKKKATAVFKPPADDLDDLRHKAVNLAVADKEVLVKPGPQGISPAQVPLLAKVQEVDEAYYRKHLARQTSRKALGFYKAHDSVPVYSKIHIPQTKGNDQYKFNIEKDLRRADDDSEDEMSDIEEMNLDDYKSEDDND